MIRWGIVGLGRIAARFAGSVMGRGDGRIAAVCSRSEDKAGAFAAACGAQPWTDLDAMLRSDLDIVYVASPNALHRPHAQACLRAGKAVLIEKPMAATAEDAEAIVEEARRSGRLAMEAMWTRFLPAVREAKRLAAGGAIGPLRGFEASLCFPQPYDPTSRHFDPSLGGGSLLDLGVYPISLALHFLGEPLEAAGLALRAPGGVDRQAAMTLRHGEALSRISCGFDAEGANDAVLIGESGRIRLQRPLYAPAALTLSHSRAPHAPATEAIPAPTRTSSGRFEAFKQMLRPARRAAFRPLPYKGDGFAHQIDEAHRCLAEGATESAVMPLKESVAAIRIIDGLRLAAPAA